MRRHEPDGALDRAVLRIAGPDGAGDIAAGGFLITPDLALTCAHVVSDALSVPRDQEPQKNRRVTVQLPLVSEKSRPVVAKVERWVPTTEGGGGDIALLRLEATMPQAEPLRMAEVRSHWGRQVAVLGFPTTNDGGLWHVGRLLGRTEQGWVQIAPEVLSGAHVEPGFSGGPVWDLSLGRAVGMVTTAQRDGARQSFLTPTDKLIEAIPELRELMDPERESGPLRRTWASAWQFLRRRRRVLVPVSLALLLLFALIKSCEPSKAGKIENKAAGGSQCISYFREPNAVKMGDCADIPPDWVVRDLKGDNLKLQSEVQPDVCLGLDSAKNIVGSWGCGVPGSVWHPTRSGEYVRLRNLLADDECLTYLPDALVPLRMRPCERGDFQKFRITGPEE